MKLIAVANGFTTSQGTTHTWEFFENNGVFFAERDDDRKSLDFSSYSDLIKSVKWFDSVGFTVRFK